MKGNTENDTSFLPEFWTDKHAIAVIMMTMASQGSDGAPKAIAEFIDGVEDVPGEQPGLIVLTSLMAWISGSGGDPELRDRTLQHSWDTLLGFGPDRAASLIEGMLATLPDVEEKERYQNLVYSLRTADAMGTTDEGSRDGAFPRASDLDYAPMVLGMILEYIGDEELEERGITDGETLALAALFLSTHPQGNPESCNALMEEFHAWAESATPNSFAETIDVACETLLAERNHEDLSGLLDSLELIAVGDQQFTTVEALFLEDIRERLGLEEEDPEEAESVASPPGEEPVSTPESSEGSSNTVSCENCGGLVSKRLEACPHCGIQVELSRDTTEGFPWPWLDAKQSNALLPDDLKKWSPLDHPEFWNSCGQRFSPSDVSAIDEVIRVTKRIPLLSFIRSGLESLETRGFPQWNPGMKHPWWYIPLVALRQEDFDPGALITCGILFDHNGIWVHGPNTEPGMLLWIPSSWIDAIDYQQEPRRSEDVPVISHIMTVSWTNDSGEGRARGVTTLHEQAISGYGSHLQILNTIWNIWEPAVRLAEGKNTYSHLQVGESYRVVDSWDELRQWRQDPSSPPALGPQSEPQDIDAFVGQQLKAAEDGDVDLVQGLIEARVSLGSEAVDEMGNTGLHHAAANGQEGILRLLREAEKSEPSQPRTQIPKASVAEPEKDPAPAMAESPPVPTCPECGGMVSRRLTACPHCGCPMDEEHAASPETHSKPAPVSARPTPQPEGPRAGTEYEPNSSPDVTAEAPTDDQGIPLGWREIADACQWPGAHRVVETCYALKPTPPNDNHRFSPVRRHFQDCEYVNFFLRKKYLSVYIKGKERDWDDLFERDGGEKPEIRRWRDGVQLRVRAEAELQSVMRWLELW